MNDVMQSVLAGPDDPSRPPSRARPPERLSSV